MWAFQECLSEKWSPDSDPKGVVYMRYDISPRWEEEISPILDRNWQKLRDWWRILQHNAHQNFLEEILATLCRQKCEEYDRGIPFSQQ